MKKKGALRKDRIFHRQILGLRHTQMSGYAIENRENLTIVAEGYGKTRFVVKREFRRESSENVRRRKTGFTTQVQWCGEQNRDHGVVLGFWCQRDHYDVRAVPGATVLG